MKKNVFIAMAFALATLTAAAQTSGASGNASGDDAFVANLKKHHRGVADLEVNGVPSRVYYTPLSRTHWSVAIVVKK